MEHADSAGAMEQLRSRLDLLARRPPSVLLLEGGNEKERMDMGLYWAMALNCTSARELSQQGQPAKPCGTCRVCRQIANNEYMDLHIFDGRITNKQDEEKPGPVRALRMENIRELKANLGVRPHGNGKRVAILQGMGSTREEALNSLLKTLEEPGENTVFVLLSPQRAQILPTLVSRSICLTLPWTSSKSTKKELNPQESSLAEFLGSGNGFMDKIAGKGAFDATMAAQLLVCCQQSLARATAGANDTSKPLDNIFVRIAGNAAWIAKLCLWLAEAQDMLSYNVSPARIWEALASRIFILLRNV